MYPLISICILSLVLLFGCQSSEEKQLEELQQQVIAIHDEIMPQMSTMIDLKEELTLKNQQLQQSGSEDAQDQVIVNEMIITNLDQAHESMMAWMRQFKKVESGADTESNRKYLHDQLEKIESVQEQMDHAMASAREAL